METSTPLKSTGKIETTPGSSKLKLIPSFPNHVFLYDWWLIKADTPSNGRLLGVGGLSSKESSGRQHGVRVLHSDAIVKRHNTNTVETSDGLTITFSGSINKRRTVLNGFPSEVCNQFIFGFPYCWEELVSKSFTKEASKSAVDNSADAANVFLSKSVDNLPGALMRDFFVSTIESSGNCTVRDIFRDMVHAYGVDSPNQRSDFVSPSEKTSRLPGDSAEDETHTGFKRNLRRRQKDEDDAVDAKHIKKPQIVARKLGIGSLTSSNSCMKVACDKQDKGNLVISPGRNQSKKSLSEGPIKRHERLVSRRNSSSLTFTTKTLSLRNRSVDFHIRCI